jgi:adenosylmethionine-8-amino-7-oxononanoate aminotransferase
MVAYSSGSPDPHTASDRGLLQRAARDHLLIPLANHVSFVEEDVPILVRGDGCYLEDIDGKRYVDGLAGLFSVAIGYSFGAEIAEAATTQLCELPYATVWGQAHPSAIELARDLAALAPSGFSRAYFAPGGGSDAVEAAWKLARQYHAAHGEHRWKAVARYNAYHGTGMGALALTDIPRVRVPFEPVAPGVVRVHNAHRLSRAANESDQEFTRFLLNDLETAIVQAGPTSIAMVIIEPVQTSAGVLLPPAGYHAGVRELCDRFGILLCADEVVSAFGRYGHWFASERFGLQPDLIVCAKALTSAYAPLGAVLISDRVAEPFVESGAVLLHAATYTAHPLACAIAHKNLEIIEREGLLARVREFEADFRSALEPLRDLPIVIDVRGAGYGFVIELVRDKVAREKLRPDEVEHVAFGLIRKRMRELGLLTRCDSNGATGIYLFPALVAGPDQFVEIVTIARTVLEEASDALAKANVIHS